MGVLACDRQGCTNIMCYYYSHEFGYLCSSCFEELVELNGRMTVEKFMRTEKSPWDISYEWAEYIRGEFKSRYEEYE